MEKQQLTIKEGTTNYVELTGKVAGDFEFSHQFNGKKFYTTIIETTRISGVIDRVPIIVSEDKLIRSRKMFKNGERVKIEGHFQSRIEKHLYLAVFVTFVDKAEETEPDKNFIYLDGYIGKKPMYKKIEKKPENDDSVRTKDLTWILLAVNRPNKRISDYIPCLAWNKMALFVRHFEMGYHLKCYGRIQSRIYYKESGEEIEVNNMSIYNFTIIEEE